MGRTHHRLYYKQNRLKQLRAFCCAAQTGSVSKAAERLHLSQSSVALQIRALERELGVAHARFHTELERFRGEDPEALRSPDPATGVWYTLGGWVKLQAWHEAHHVSQVRRIIAAPGFPRE